MVNNASFALPAELNDRIAGHLSFLYGADRAGEIQRRLIDRLAHFAGRAPRQSGTRERLPLTAADAMVIIYGDQIREPGEAPLRTLADWLRTQIGDAASSVHILPFYPYSSDNGFSVIDYTAVDPALGEWSDVEALARSYRLMFDAVINHISSESAWFQGFLRGDPRYADYVVVVDQPADLSGVTRPRTHPLLTTFETASGAHRVWTTFSADQIDLNYHNPEVLLAVVDVLLEYVAHGAAYLRLDAIGYLWKTIGTSCIHLPETHVAVQLIRSVLDAVAPEVLLITETNVPHKDNISYFGDGYNEAQLVYQFPLAPLVLNAFLTGRSRHLTEWAAGIESLSAATTFFNFLASHDGIGVMPAAGILDAEEIEALVQMTLRHGGNVSYKSNPDGSQSAYELNITLFDALSDPASADEATAIDRFMAAQAIMLALAGLPGIYIHSLIGSSNDLEGVAATGRARSINRKKWQRAELDARLADPGAREHIVLSRYIRLLRSRAASQAFDPAGAQEIVGGNDALFVVRRTSPDGSASVLCLHNLTDKQQTFGLEGQGIARGALHELIADREIALGPAGMAKVVVPPYGVLWLKVG